MQPVSRPFPSLESRVIASFRVPLLIFSSLSIHLNLIDERGGSEALAPYLCLSLPLEKQFDKLTKVGKPQIITL